MYLIEYPKIFAYPADIATFLHTSDNMHACIECLPKASEALKSTSYCRILLYYSYLHTFLGKDCSGKEASQSSAYYYCTLFHSIMCLIPLSVYILSPQEQVRCM